MGIETFNYIDSLNTANPTSTDNVSEGDDHIRGIKTTLKNTLPNVNGAVNATDEELNVVDMSASGSTSGQLLTSTGTSTVATWQNAPVSLPAQSDPTTVDQYLQSDGTDASWQTLDTDSNTTTKGLYEMVNTISVDYSISSGSNAISAGPITINTGVSVTIPTGSTWVIA